MRVRPTRSVLTRRPERRAHGTARGAAPAPPTPLPAEAHPHEKRARESGGPIDRASYTCTCGMIFEAPVSTSVSCPNCGAGQAW
jgi:hypothetical protein